MCTVTFIPRSGGVLMASNRDEVLLRSNAKAPEAYTLNGRKIVFPKDNKAGGTWIAIHENGHVMVLLNGAYNSYTRGTSYRRSRGLIFLDIFQEPDPLAQFERIDLDNIEPFSLVLWAGGRLHDLRWDGARKFKTEEDPALTHIWSSTALYSPQVRRQRELWFSEWLSARDIAHITIEDLTQFHTFGGNGADEENRLVMHLGTLLETISITTIDWMPDKAVMHYKDLVHDTDTFVALPVHNIL